GQPPETAPHSAGRKAGRSRPPAQSVVPAAPLPVAGELAHHGLHAADDFGPALRPAFGRLNRTGPGVRPAVADQWIARQPALRVSGRRRPGAEAAEPNEESKRSENRYGFTHWTVLCMRVSEPKMSC